MQLVVPLRQRERYIVRVVDFHISQSKIKRSCVLLYYYHEVHVFRLLTGRAFFFSDIWSVWPNPYYGLSIIS